MSIHNLSCFEIENASALRMDYRLVNLGGPFDPNLGDGDLAERNLQQLVKRLQYDERIPVAIERFGPEPRLAIPANHLLKRTEYELTPDVAMLTPQNEVHALSFSSGGAADRIGLGFPRLVLSHATVQGRQPVVIRPVNLPQQAPAQLPAGQPRNRCLSRLRLPPRVGLQPSVRVD